jgi:nucleoside 2-deoxyribosyltransferase
MKIYIAAPWVRKADAIEVGHLLRERGHIVTSRWFDHEGDPSDSTGVKSPIHEMRRQALEDIEDVRRSDLLLVLNLEKSEGKAVETGIALAAGVHVIAVGGRSNIFQALGTEVASLDDAFDHITNLTQALH